MNYKIIQRRNIKFIDFEKLLFDTNISLPEVSKLVKVSEKNL